jgi:UDP-N-acetylmuramyl pentapeptide phosphotransferase/UDP-N-acetylglucosamine-1-phosphate transferase
MFIPSLINPIVIFLIAFLTTYFIIPKIIWVVNSRDLIDKPDHRSSHVKSTPTMAGVSFFLAIIMSVFFAKQVDSDSIGVNLIVALTIIFIIGLKDDLVVSSPKAKIGGQIMAILAVITSNAFQFTDFNNFLGIGIVPLFITIPLAVFVMLAIINSYNLIDGIDGLASIIGIVIFSGYATIFYMIGLEYYFLISLSFIGVLCAYLRYNFSISKKIFMGDTGSLIMGFCIAFLTMKFISTDLTLVKELPFLLENKIIVVLSIIFIPVFDTLRVMGIRLLNKKSIFYPDRNHIHHILIDSGLKHYKASLFLAVLNVLLIALFMFLSNHYNSFEMMIITFFVFISFLILFYKLKSNLKSTNKFKKVINLVNYFF